MKWISVMEALPDRQQEVLFTNAEIKRPDGSIMEPTVSCGFYFGFMTFKSWVDTRDNMTATHWMPEPPKFEKPT